MKLTNEEWELLSVEEQDERADEKPEEIANPVPEGETGVKQEEVGDDGVPLKNRLAESQRKLEAQAKRTAELEAEINLLKTSPASPAQKETELDELKQKFIEEGYSEGLVDTLIKTVSSFASKSDLQTRKELEQLKISQAKESRKSILKEMQSADSKGIIAKYRKEIDDELDSYDPRMAGDPTVVDVAVSRVIKRHLSELLDGKPAIGSPAVEGTPASASVSGIGGQLEKKAKYYAEANNIDIKRAREIVQKKEQALKSNE